MIKIENLDFSYKKTPIFHNISLTLEPGNIYGLLGENGVGKTTLLKLVSGLLAPKKGCCRVDGMDTFERCPAFLENIVFLPDAVSLPENATPRKYIDELAPFYHKYSQGFFLDLMREMDVDPNRKFSEMSFGQQKKSLIACALSLGTDYVLLDEPTNGLDIPSKADFRKLLLKRADENTTIIISTHQVRDVENMIDPIIILAHDAVLLNANVQTIAEKLCFSIDSAEVPGALYSEPQPGGYMNVTVNTTGEESQVNIEALFNTVLRNRETIAKLFN